MAAEYEYGATPLSGTMTVASWRRINNPSATAYGPQLRIHSASLTDEGAHTPASDVFIYGREQLLALRKAIDEALLYSEVTS